MPIFEDIKYEIKDEKVFQAVKECREYIAKKGTRCLISKIWYVARKYNLPYMDHKPMPGDLGLKWHVLKVIELVSQKGMTAMDKKQQAMRIQSLPTATPSKPTTAKNATEYIKEKIAISEYVWLKELVTKLEFMEDSVPRVTIRIPKAYDIFRDHLEKALVDLLPSVPWDVYTNVIEE